MYVAFIAFLLGALLFLLNALGVVVDINLTAWGWFLLALGAAATQWPGSRRLP